MQQDSKQSIGVGLKGFTDALTRSEIILVCDQLSQHNQNGGKVIVMDEEDKCFNQVHCTFEKESGQTRLLLGEQTGGIPIDTNTNPAELLEAIIAPWFLRNWIGNDFADVLSVASHASSVRLDTLYFNSEDDLLSKLPTESLSGSAPSRLFYISPIETNVSFDWFDNISVMLDEHFSSCNTTFTLSAVDSTMSTSRLQIISFEGKS